MQFFAEDAEFHDPPNLPDSRVVSGQGCDCCLFDGSGQGYRAT